MIDFDKLYREQYKVQVCVINRCVHNMELSEDIVQEAYSRALKYQTSFDENRSSIKTWFNRIMFNVLRDSKKVSKKVVEEEFDEAGVLEDPKFERSDDNLNLIQSEIDLVRNENTKFILRLFYILGYRTDEIVKVVDVTQTQITSTCWRFKARLLNKYEMEI